jgi:hypothetical protein
MNGLAAASSGIFEQAIPWQFAKPSVQFRFIKPSPTSIAGTGQLERDFRRLADAWRQNTQFSSSIADIVLDSSYQQIIGMGSAVVPLILKDLKNATDHWYWALGSITKENPAQDAPDGDIAAICQAWLDWGKRRGIVD